MKKALTQKQIVECDRLCYERDLGRLLPPDGLRFICESCNYDPGAIGRHFLEVLPQICPQEKP